jgi:phage recombination protein Bet
MNAFGIAKNIKDDQKKQFTEVAKAFQLNPFKREIHCIAYNGTLSLIVGYEVYLKRAERSGKLAGWKVWTEGSLSDKSLKAICEIHRKDWWTPLVHEVYYIEYMRNTQIWREKPYTMIKKLAIAQAFRLAFPDELGGMPYTAEEQWETQVIEKMPTENNHNIVKQDIPIAVEVKPEAEAKAETAINPENSEKMQKIEEITSKNEVIQPKKAEKSQKSEEKPEKQKSKKKEKNYKIIKNLYFPVDYAIEDRETKTGENKGNPYWLIEVRIKDNEKMKLYLFDQKLHDAIVNSSVPIDIHFVEKEKNGKVFCEIIDIHETLPF